MVLLDRAIRLYIENELVKPDCDVSYNGRKKIDFSEEDVKQLKNIATLRKADFTIAEIKSIMEGGEASKQTLQKFIKNTTEIFEKNRLILKSLEPLADEDNITVELICSHLDNAVAEEPVPVSDMKMNFLEKRENIFYLCWSGLGITIYLFCMLSTTPDYLYPAAAEDFWTMVKLLVIFQLPLISPLVLFILRIVRTFFKKIEIEAISMILTILTLFSIIVTPFMAIINAITTPCIESRTENPENYLVVDDKVKFYNDEIYKYFPTHIPFLSDYEDTVKYFYRYNADAGGTFDIVAEWKLEKKEYKKEKKRLLSKKDDIKWERTREEWKCVYFGDTSTSVDDYNCIIFAYNDKINTVRYIFSNNEASGVPYYFNLEW